MKYIPHDRHTTVSSQITIIAAHISDFAAYINMGVTKVHYFCLHNNDIFAIHYME